MRKINLKKFQVATNLTAREINRRIILNLILPKESEGLAVDAPSFDVEPASAIAEGAE